MIKVNSKAAAEAWVAAWRRASDARLSDERLRRSFLLWWMEVVPRIYPGETLNN